MLFGESECPQMYGTRSIALVTEIRAIGFDLDGTLFDHLGSATDGVNVFLRYLGVEPSDAARAVWFAAEETGFELWRTGQISFQEQRRYRLETVLPALGVARPESADGLDQLFEEYLREYRGAWRAFSDAARVLTELRSRGVQLGILTNGRQEQQVAKLRAIGLYEQIDFVLTAEALGVWKPDRNAFDALAGQFGVAPDECLFVGDHPEQDIVGALAAGMSAVLIDHYADDTAGLEPVLDYLGVAR